MNHVKVFAKSIKDDTGRITETPTMLVEQNIEITSLWSLHQHLVENQVRSQTKPVPYPLINMKTFKFRRD